MFGPDYTMNLYRGCCHGCIYCDSRSDCYRVEDFDTVRVKENALAVLRDDLRRKLRPGIVGMGAMSDPYNPFERELELTRCPCWTPMASGSPWPPRAIWWSGTSTCSGLSRAALRCCAS